MSMFSEYAIRLKSFVLMARGYIPWENKTEGLLVLDRQVSEFHNPRRELNAHGFDSGSLRSSFETHQAARTHLKDIQSGKIKINELRGIDPQAIRIHELVYELRGIDFSDEEDEIITVIGALDTMKYSEKSLVKHAFPDLVDTQITVPENPLYHTRSGDPPSIAFSSYVGVTTKLRAQFNETAANFTKGERLPVPPGNSAAEAVHNFYGRNSFFRSLQDIAEEIGKARLNVQNEGGHEHVLAVRLYDFNNTYKPEPPAVRIDPKILALEAIARQEPAVARVLMDALRVRGYGGRQDKPANDPNARLIEAELACK